MQFRRFAVYHLPDGALGDFGASWLGWDVRAGAAVAHPDDLSDAAEVTQTPRRYGFHATLKAPFRLAQGREVQELALALRMICDRLAPFALELAPSRDWGFAALRPRHQPPELIALESSVVTRLDEFRAQHIRGAIISLPLESSIAERLVKENPDIACLFLDVSPETEVSCVRCDHRDGCGACVRHLWELGHR